MCVCVRVCLYSVCVAVLNVHVCAYDCVVCTSRLRLFNVCVCVCLMRS